MEINNLIATGKLYEAVAMLSEEVKKKPQELRSRQLLAELLCIANEWQRADNQFETFTSQSQNNSEVLLYRWLIRAEQLRSDCFNGDRLPHFIEAPTPCQQLIVKALTEKRCGNMVEVGKLFAQAKKLLPNIQGLCNNKHFTGLMDGDDWCLNWLEIFTSKGEYYWIPFEMLRKLKMYQPQYLMDSIWRKGHLTLQNGTAGDVYIPAIYINTPKESELGKLGQITDWINHDDQVTGIGQRILIAGEDQITIMDLKDLLIEAIQ